MGICDVLLAITFDSVPSILGPKSPQEFRPQYAAVGLSSGRIFIILNIYLVIVYTIRTYTRFPRRLTKHVNDYTAECTGYLHRFSGFLKSFKNPKKFMKSEDPRDRRSQIQGQNYDN